MKAQYYKMFWCRLLKRNLVRVNVKVSYAFVGSQMQSKSPPRMDGTIYFKKEPVRTTSGVIWFNFPESSQDWNSLCGTVANALASTACHGSNSLSGKFYELISTSYILWFVISYVQLLWICFLPGRPLNDKRNISMHLINTYHSTILIFL